MSIIDRTLRPAAEEAPPALVREISREVARAKQRRAQVLIGRVGLILLIVAAWQIFSGKPGEPGVLIDSFYISRPSDIVEALSRWVADGILLTNIAATMQVTLIGFTIGAGLGLVVGFALGVNPFLSAVVSPIIAALYAIPRLALIPLFLLWFGLGIGSKLALVITVVFFLVFYNTHEGVRDVDRGLIDVMRVMKASKWQIYRAVTLPSAMTWIIAGLRISVPYALVATVTAEMMASNSGMGYLIIRASGQFYTAGVFAGILVIMVFALLLGAIVSFAEKRLLRWKPDRLT
ncbi:ABC transporter permease [Microbacterium sp. MAHUQ-60]|uniref:ABC transporter permease n=1 Tax=unclassified Microbacterium TaxID=2609290 RepID=UPI00361C91FD